MCGEAFTCLWLEILEVKCRMGNGLWELVSRVGPSLSGAPLNTILDEQVAPRKVNDMLRISILKWLVVVEFKFRKSKC